MDEKKTALCAEIIAACRSELCDLFPHLDGAFGSLTWKETEHRGFRVDGDVVWYHPDDLICLYARSPEALRRGYLHMLLHCLFLHLYSGHTDDRLWNLACDMAVENLIEKQKMPRLSHGKNRNFLRNLDENTKSAEQIYEFLKESGNALPPEEDFAFDDHSWTSIGQGSRDHSVVEDMVEKGDLTRDEARHHPRRNLITRALGTEPGVAADAFPLKWQQGDFLLLCSDGLINTVSDQELLFEVIHSEPLDTCLDRLLALSRQRGAPDNVTAVLLMNI